MKYLFTSLFLLLLLSPNGKSAIAYSTPSFEVSATRVTSKVKKKKNRLNKKIKKATNKKSKERKNKFGRLGLLVLLGGIFSLVLFDALFILSLLGSIVLGIIGLMNDEKKTAAILAVALPVAFILGALIAVGIAFST